MSRFPAWSIAFTISVKLCMHYISPMCTTCPIHPAVLYSTHRGSHGDDYEGCCDFGMWSCVVLAEMYHHIRGTWCYYHQYGWHFKQSTWHLLPENSNPTFLIWSPYYYFVKLLIM
jgi:hypothetical protein